MLIVLSGPSCVGKSYTVDYLCRGHKFQTVVPYTTRRPRTSEIAEIHYRFRSKREIERISAGLSCGYWAMPLGEHIYGFTDEVDNLAKDDNNWVIPTYSNLALQLKAKNPTAYIVFLDFQTPEALTARIKSRCNGNEHDFLARLSHAEHERQNKSGFDHKIESDSYQEVALKVAEYARLVRAK